MYVARKRATYSASNQKLTGIIFFNENLQVAHISENVADRQLPMLN